MKKSLTVIMIGFFVVSALADWPSLQQVQIKTSHNDTFTNLNSESKITQPESDAVITQGKKVFYLINTVPHFGVGFMSMLQKYGFEADIINIEALPYLDFSSAGVFIIDSWMYAPSIDPALIQLLKNSAKPVIGIGGGGLAVVDSLTLSIQPDFGPVGLLDTTHTEPDYTSIRCLLPEMIIFQWPNFITMPSDSILKLYENSDNVAVRKPVSLPAFVDFIGQVPFHEQFYTLASEAQKYWLWGYCTSAKSMTKAGQDLFANIVAQLLKESSMVRFNRHEIPKNFLLRQNYPNPFNATTCIPFTIKTGTTSLQVFDINGAYVRTLVNAFIAAGSYTVTWDGRNEKGEPVPSGIYFYQIDNKAGRYVKSMLLVK